MQLSRDSVMSAKSPAPARQDKPPELVATARQAQLRYWSDHAPAIRRLRSGQGFRYVGPRGRTISNETTLARIRKLAIPPAWTGVRICPFRTWHLQLD